MATATTTLFNQAFDARQHDPSTFPPPPVLADYHVRVVSGEVKANNSGTGGYAQFDLEILTDGPYKGRTIKHIINLYHNDPGVVEGAKRQLSALCHVTGVWQIQDLRQVFGIPFIASIGPQKNDPRFASVFYVKDLQGNIPGNGTQPGATQATQANPFATPAAPPQAPANPYTQPQQPQAPAFVPPQAPPANPYAAPIAPQQQQFPGMPGTQAPQAPQAAPWGPQQPQQPQAPAFVPPGAPQAPANPYTQPQAPSNPYAAPAAPQNWQPGAPQTAPAWQPPQVR